MPRTAAAPPVITTTQIPKDLMVKKVEVVTLLPTLAQEVAELDVTDDDSYRYADSLLGRVRSAGKVWGGIWDKIQERTIKPLRASLEGLYETNREITKPIETMETAIKTAMKDYKTEESRRLQAAETARLAEVRRLQDEADKKAAQAQAAGTAQLRGRLEAARRRLEEEAQTVRGQEKPEAVVGQSSTTRAIPSWRLIHDEENGSHLIELLGGIIEGKVPEDAILLNEKFISATFKAKPEVVASWPGVEIFDDIQIVGR